MGINSISFLAVDSEVIRKALLNTVMCISVVFIILIFISVIISLFKYINAAEKRFAQKNAPVEIVKSEPLVSDTLEEDVEEDLTDDLELAAVITAAIQAYEESRGIVVPADGLVVRSIRKANKSKWQA